MAAQDAQGDDGTKFEHVAHVLQSEIERGVYREGQRIPTQKELEDRFGVSRDTVLRAQRLLREGGWIETKRGSGSRVADPLPERSPDRGGIPVEEGKVDLAEYIRRAFEADEVTLDCMSMTSETMDYRVRTQVERIEAGEIAPRSITLRLILPSRRIELAFPRSAVDPADPRPRDRHRRLITRHAEALHSALSQLREFGLVENVSVNIRSVPFTPNERLYVLNRDQLLTAPYIVEQRSIKIDNKPIEIIDSVSRGKTLFPYHASNPEQAPKVVAYQEMFDSYWQLIAQDEDFGD